MEKYNKREAYRQRHRESGLCILCSEPVADTTEYCVKHRKHFRNKSNEGKKLLLLQKKCVRCGRKLDEDRDGEKSKICALCTEYHTMYTGGIYGCI